MDILQDLPLSDLKYWIQVLEKEEILNIPDMVSKSISCDLRIFEISENKIPCRGWNSKRGGLKGFIGLNNPAQAGTGS